jgi:sugar/nucleoside kinase (ribokinase family)
MSSAQLEPSPTHEAAVFGLLVADLLAEPMDLRNPPAPGGLVITRQIKLAPGGNVCNTGLALSRLGISTLAVGRVGEDSLGRSLLDELRDAGIDVARVEVDPLRQTSATIVAVEPGGERVFFHTRGACEALDANFVRRSFELLPDVRILHIGYFGLLDPSAYAELPEAIARYKARCPRTLVALDTVHPPADVALLKPILPRLDIFCPSRSEARHLTQLDDPDRMIDQLRAWHFEGLCAIKLDAEGCLVDTNGDRRHVPSFKVDVVDTTGAGDTWYAGLMAGLLRGLDPFDSARIANRVAGDCCTRLGARDGVRDWPTSLRSACLA